MDTIFIYDVVVVDCTRVVVVVSTTVVVVTGPLVTGDAVVVDIVGFLPPHLTLHVETVAILRKILVII